LPAVIAAAVKENSDLNEHREAMKAAIREEYTWRRSAETLLGLISVK
jgi:hypothetical protein